MLLRKKAIPEKVPRVPHRFCLHQRRLLHDTLVLSKWQTFSFMVMASKKSYTPTNKMSESQSIFLCLCLFRYHYSLLVWKVIQHREETNKIPWAGNASAAFWGALSFRVLTLKIRWRFIFKGNKSRKFKGIKRFLSLGNLNLPSVSLPTFLPGRMPIDLPLLPFGWVASHEGCPPWHTRSKNKAPQRATAPCRPEP